MQQDYREERREEPWTRRHEQEYRGKMIFYEKKSQLHTKAEHHADGWKKILTFMALGVPLILSGVALLNWSDDNLVSFFSLIFSAMVFGLYVYNDFGSNSKAHMMYSMLYKLLAAEIRTELKRPIRYRTALDVFVTDIETRETTLIFDEPEIPKKIVKKYHPDLEGMIRSPSPKREDALLDMDTPLNMDEPPAPTSTPTTVLTPVVIHNSPVHKDDNVGASADAGDDVVGEDDVVHF